MKLFSRRLFSRPKENPPDWSSISLPQLPQRANDTWSMEPPIDPDRLESKFSRRGISATVAEIDGGPVVASYTIVLDDEASIRKLQRELPDLTRILGVESMRIVGAVSGHNALVVEVPATQRGTVTLSSLLESEAFQGFDGEIPIALGVSSAGEPIIRDLAAMPHLLVAGTTGSGKSVFLNSLITTILSTRRPDECVFYMVDPKRVDLSIFGGLPHLVDRIATHEGAAVQLIKTAVALMERRYEILAKRGCRNIKQHNEQYDEKMERIVMVIDEFASLMYQYKKIDISIAQLAAEGRAAGIHLVVATQRPSVDVITGVIKANFDKRIAFRCATKVDSGVILDRQAGAEQLLGHGDGLFMDERGIHRIHGPFIADEDIETVVNYWKGIATEEQRNYLA